MAALIKDVMGDLKHWGKNLREDNAIARQRERMVKEGGVRDNGNAMEGRRVGMDFFLNPRGPPDDLRRGKDGDYPGRYGLAGEYQGNRELANPWQWNCVWEEMGIPAETRKALEMDQARGMGGRVVRDNGVYPAAQGDAMQKEAEDLQMEANIERQKLQAERLAQLIQYDDHMDRVIRRRLKWVRNNGKWQMDGEIADEQIALAARKGVDFLNETPFFHGRPDGEVRPRRQHEMLSQLNRPNTIRDLSKIPAANPPYAWGEEECAGRPGRCEWDVRSLMRGERRTLAEARAKGISPAWPMPRLTVSGGDGGAQTISLVEEGEDGRVLRVFHPGGKRWDGNTFVRIPPALVTVRTAPNKNFGLNHGLFHGYSGRDGYRAGTYKHGMGTGNKGHVDDGGGPAVVEAVLDPPAHEFRVFHHVGVLVEGEPHVHGGRAGKILNGGSVLPPDRRMGVVEADGYLGGEWKLGDAGVLGGDGQAIGRRFADVDGAGRREPHGEVVYGHFKRAGNANYGLNKELLAPSAPKQGEASRFVDFGDGRVGCVFEESQRPMPHRRKGRSDIRSVGVSNTFCER